MSSLFHPTYCLYNCDEIFAISLRAAASQCTLCLSRITLSLSLLSPDGVYILRINQSAVYSL